MINIYKTVEGKMVKQDEVSEGCWINVISPNQKEVAYLIDTLGVDRGFIGSVLDEEESSRIESDEGQTLLVVDIPMPEQSADTHLAFTTMPIGIILMEKYLLTVSLRENVIMQEIAAGNNRHLNTNLKTRFLLNILLKVATRFLIDLKEIDRISSNSEKKLHKSMRNKELFQLLGLEKSLVYFSTSLKSNEVTMEKILRGRIIKMYEEDQELLEDVLIEVKQAIEMCSIYSGILSGTMDTFASIISNNLNIVMKRLSAITIIMAIPTTIFSFYGMNVTYLPLANSWFPTVIAGVFTLAVAGVLYKKGMF